jgi:UDP-2-acetamido-3-amino-2,3-dideoxy-glucuronate N-acetyltransferase
MTMSYYIHPSSVIDRFVRIGKNSKIWHWCHISENSTIGPDCTLGQNVFIGKNVKISSNVKIQNNVSVFTGVKIKKNCFIGPSVVFTNVLMPRSFVNQKNNFLETIINEGVTIGANATIVCGNKIGKFALVGANTLINKNLKPYGLYVGNPARRIGWVSVRGKKLNLPVYGNGKAICPYSKQVYELKNNNIYTKDKI